MRHPNSLSVFRDVPVIIIATFRLEYEGDYEYEVTVLSVRFRLAGRKFSKCACSVLLILVVVLVLQSEGRCYIDRRREP